MTSAKYKHGYSIGSKQLYTNTDDLYLPKDLHLNVGITTKTWYSASEGDYGQEYLRQYGNGKYAIHLGTWHSGEELGIALDTWSDTAGQDWVNMFKVASVELDRRILAITHHTCYN